MIENIKLQRFKRFDHLSISTRRLTVLTGTNGSGKTSVLHAVLLARQAANAGNGSVQLNGPDGLQLGEAAQLVNYRADVADSFAVTVQDEHGGDPWLFAVSDERSMTAEIDEAASNVPAVLRASGRGFSYLSADRLGPKDTLPAAATLPGQLTVGVRGEFVAHVLNVLDRHKVAEGRRHPDTTPATLIHQVEGWLATMTRPLNIKADWFPGSAVTQLMFKSPGALNEWVKPPNMGFGISSVLPIVVAGLVAEPGGLLLIENPEIHLHPAGQSAVGRFLALLAADGVQVIVETHSDHVINGMRRAVAEDALPSDQVMIHYFDDDVTEICIDHRGKLSHWPAGFFDQMDVDLEAIARRQRG